MSSYSYTHEIKVYGFDAAQGKVPGHAILTHDYEWLGMYAGQIDRVAYVIYERWDDEAEMTIKVEVPVAEWTRYMKKAWPKGGTIYGVRLISGRLLPATGMVVSHGGDGKRYENAPILARDTFAVKLLTGQTLIEVAGVQDWIYGRSSVDRDGLIYNPVERDNAAFNARMNELADKVQP